MKRDRMLIDLCMRVDCCIVMVVVLWNWIEMVVVGGGVL